jgi:hypothetical protein
LNPFEKIGFRFVILFTVLMMLTVPFPWHIIPHPGNFTHPLFEGFAGWFGEHLFGLKQPFTAKIISDSTGMYIHTFLIAVLAFAGSLIWIAQEKQSIDDKKVWYGFAVMVRHYLALQLLIYGFDKIFKHQFFLPEPNTLFTPMGNLSHDILYWSSVGSSYTYSVFSGIAEVIPAFLLLFRPTARLGALIALGVMAHVVLINFGFDISVKLYSIFLLWLAFILLFPDLKKILQTLVLNRGVSFTEWKPQWNTKGKLLFYSIAKPMIIGVILFESLFVYFQSGNFNDDRAPRPQLWGAYEVESFVHNGIMLPSFSTEPNRFRRIFIHRRGYFIVQMMDDSMKDYRLRYDSSSGLLFLTDGAGVKTTLNFSWSELDSSFRIQGVLGKDSMNIVARKIDLQKLPLLNPGFHWTIDGFK